MRSQISREAQLFEIPRQLLSCLEHLRTRCNFHCCGIAACELSPLLIEQWMVRAGPVKIREAVDQAKVIVTLLRESPDLLACETINFRDAGVLAPSGDLFESNVEKRQKLAEFFAGLSCALAAHLEADFTIS